MYLLIKVQHLYVVYLFGDIPHIGNVLLCIIFFDFVTNISFFAKFRSCILSTL